MLYTQSKKEFKTNGKHVMEFVMKGRDLGLPTWELMILDP